MVTAVVFDVGETLLDDSREWGAWADWVGVPRHTFSTVLGAVTAAGRDNAETFEYLRPGFDLAHERQLREDAGLGERIEESTTTPFYTGLLALGLRDAYRELNPAGGDHSWVNPRFGSQRQDHSLVSAEAGEIRACVYDHSTRSDDLSDHAALLTTIGLWAARATTNGRRPW